MKEIIARVKAPTPKFFKKLRNIGLALTAAGTAIVTAPVTLPATLVSIAGYVLLAGGVAAAVSQATVASK